MRRVSARMMKVKRELTELTKEQRAQLERLRNMPDEEIDFSDIPETLDWTGAVRGMFYRPRKVEATLRLDDDIVSWFEERFGENDDKCDVEVNDALRDYVVRRERTAAVASLEQSDAAFDNDEVVEGALKLWEAAAHAVTSAAVGRKWPVGNRRLLKSASVRLSDETGDLTIAGGYACAEEFSRHHSVDWMEDWERDANRPSVKEFVRRVLGVGFNV